eukprot:CAMPEP_0198336612 /NCGR_PEP_ID=MMETSP1450-20131203/21089_1 /TAXON_ID=753684 ORGANISM="Madagascaria erythrocladiodes, Strain CCMP3234" /NCGR_SAMPLE_ID=MMETSP1450 /ASSEMBLY_ACC=CAM_ASM_001115 /LENGTH=327 /DNA_ID=CAMNT_0044041363 /DNA_START=156 /DNA_END=1139 /DNA_ORIENTATION=-
MGAKGDGGAGRGLCAVKSVFAGVVLISFVSAATMLSVGTERPIVDAHEDEASPSRDFFLSNEENYDLWKRSLPQARWFEFAPYYEKKYHFVHCSLPKNGCTQQKSLLRRLNGDDGYLNPKRIHQAPAKDGLTRITSLPDQQAIAVLSDPAVPKYMLPRNPVLRTLSAYIDKIESKSQHPGFPDWVVREFGRKPPPRTSCEAFAGMDQHWRPQICFCGLLHTPLLYRQFKFEDPQPMVDFLYGILPLEILESGWGRNGTASFRENFSASQKSSHFHGTDEKYLHYFTPEVFEILVTVLQPEIELFGYQKDIVQMRTAIQAKAEREKQA